MDTIGQPAHSRTDPLGHAATAADRDTQSARGLQAPKIADSSDNLHVFAPGSKEERRQQLPNTVYTTGQQENTRTVASEQTAPVANLDTPSVSTLHIEKIANIGVISRTFASDSKEQHSQQLPNTVSTTGQQESTRTVASEQTATVVNRATPSVSALHSKKIANIDVISRTFAMDSKEECPQQLSDTVCSIGQQENTCAVASDHTAAVANPATQSVRGLHVDKIANSGAILRAFATGNEEQCLQQPSDTVCTHRTARTRTSGCVRASCNLCRQVGIISERSAGCKNR